MSRSNELGLTSILPEAFLSSLVSAVIPVTMPEQIQMHLNVVRAEVEGVKEAAVHSLVDTMTRSYCGTLALQFMHLLSREQQQWLTARAEEPWHMDSAARHVILKGLLQAGVSCVHALCCFHTAKLVTKNQVTRFPIQVYIPYHAHATFTPYPQGM